VGIVDCDPFSSAGFLKKYGGEIMGACSDTGTKFYFKDGYRSQTDHAYQVTRSDFDKVLLDHAAESGANNANIEAKERRFNNRRD
jgi:flavin-dependent dehydrogenase